MLLIVGALIVIVFLCWVLIDSPHESDHDPPRRHDRHMKDRDKHWPHHHG